MCLNLRESRREKNKKTQPMCSGSSLPGIVSIGFSRYNKESYRGRIRCDGRNWNAMSDLPRWERSKVPPRFLARPLVLKCLLKRTYVEEVRAGDKVPRCLAATELREQLGTVGGEHLRASFELASKALLFNCSCCRFVPWWGRMALCMFLGFSTDVTKFPYFPPGLFLYRGKWSVHFSWAQVISSHRLPIRKQQPCCSWVAVLGIQLQVFSGKRGEHMYQARTYFCNILLY